MFSNTIQTGMLLISDPFLKDPNFIRSVIILCEHDNQGSVGFVLNKLYPKVLGSLLTEVSSCNFPVYHGGPVQEDTVHFLHRRPDLIEDGLEIMNGIFWGGSFEQVIECIHLNKISSSDIRFFIGYSGWGKNQLQEEVDEKSWILRNSNVNLIFATNTQNIWNNALKDLGGEYALMTNYPIDPQLN